LIREGHKVPNLSENLKWNSNIAFYALIQDLLIVLIKKIPL
jgi:hypothetical protein